MDGLPSPTIPSAVTPAQVVTLANSISNAVASIRVDFITSTLSESVLIDAVDYEIDCRRLDGKTDFVSVYGLTGDFEGWFSNDEARVPILAKMKVILGSVTIELMAWNRTGWKPPKG
jgi:hypothetical protein